MIAQTYVERSKRVLINKIETFVVTMSRTTRLMMFILVVNLSSLENKHSQCSYFMGRVGEGHWVKQCLKGLFTNYFSIVQISYFG